MSIYEPCGRCGENCPMTELHLVHVRDEDEGEDIYVCRDCRLVLAIEAVTREWEEAK